MENINNVLAESVSTIKRLKEENESLKKEQELMFVLFEALLEASKETRLLPGEDAKEDVADRSDKIGVLLEHVRELSK